MIIVDTNVVSELMRPAPDAVVADWVRRHGGRQLWTTSITLAEIYYGIERLTDGRRKERIQTTASQLFGSYPDRILAFDAAAARQYSLVVADRDRVGLPIDGFDAQIAAVCRVNDASLATRNTKDFQDTGIEVINPWLPTAEHP